ncbi:MAG TPA: hypothetical protein VH933_05425 [Aestuariivirgaceae bacterium]|jgi:uncharacterized protein (DUF305 family)
MEHIEEELEQATEVAALAASLVQAQEATVAQMKADGLNASRAEILLEAYRQGARLAEARRQALRARSEQQRGH